MLPDTSFPGKKHLFSWEKTANFFSNIILLNFSLSIFVCVRATRPVRTEITAKTEV
jgi:hypothetical protein